MIISASRRTDIPALFGDWFMHRIRAGYFLENGPMGVKQQKIISLMPEDVDCFVFMTKYPAPFLKNLELLDKRGYRYYFQYTLNDYPLCFEPHLPPLSERTEVFKRLSEKIGPSRVVWRYDPIIISNHSSVEYHIQRFARLAFMLENYTRRVTISFLNIHGNSKLRNFVQLNKLTGEDITAAANREKLAMLVRNLSTIARATGLEIQTCTESVNLERYGVRHGKCVDEELINKLYGLSLKYKKDPAQPLECLCAGAADMGSYNTCKYQCSYCYAIRDERAVMQSMQRHNVKSPSLLGS